jgi:hypothetical protein
MEKFNITAAGFQGTPPVVKSPEHKNIYANAIRTGVGPFDIRATFGHVIERDDQKLVSEDLVTVVMSPEEAKTFLKMMANAVQGYEMVFGEIKDVDAIIEQRAKAAQPNPS